MFHFTGGKTKSVFLQTLLFIDIIFERETYRENTAFLKAYSKQCAIATNEIQSEGANNYQPS
jgi:hypothetical protein